MNTLNPHIMEPDATLLDRYATQRDESAFRQLVERHAGMVLGVARRRTQDATLGEEAGQIVFTLLARKASALRHLPPDKLAGWLHRTALLTAGNLLRSEMRRAIHHARFAGENADPCGPDNSSWAAALPFVDEAIDSLPEADRRLVVQHFYQRRTFRELSSGTGRTEDAVRKRTGRALERLSAFFKRRGVTLSAGTIMSGLAAHTMEAAPAGYAATATAAAVSNASSLSTLAVIANTLAAMAFTKITVTAATVAFFIPLGLHWSETASAAPAAESHSAPAGAKNSNIDTAPGGSAPASSAPAAARSATLARFAQELAKVTPPPADEQRLGELQRLAFVLTEDELPEALELLSGAETYRPVEKVVAAVAARWAEFDPVTALRMTASLRNELHNPVWAGALQVWARRDFNAAFAWTCRQPDGDERNTQLDIVYNDLMKRDPAAAMARLGELPTEAKRIQFKRSTLEVWRASDPDAAIAWLSNNGPEEERESKIADFITDGSEYRPDLAFSCALKYITDRHKLQDTLQCALEKWDDLPAAIAAIINLPSEMRTAEMAWETASVASDDPAAFLEATRQLPAGEFRDHLQVPVVTQIAATDSPKARQMMESFTSTSARQMAARTIAQRWIGQDPAAAREWIESTPDLDADVRERLLSQIKK